jgi:hypothetical protein
MPHKSNYYGEIKSEVKGKRKPCVPVLMGSNAAAGHTVILCRPTVGPTLSAGGYHPQIDLDGNSPTGLFLPKSGLGYGDFLTN